MAAMAADEPSAPQEHLGVPSRNPLPLSASQEAQVRDIFYARVRKNCSDEIKGELPFGVLATNGDGLNQS
jgi:COX assembly protein 1